MGNAVARATGRANAGQQRSRLQTIKPVLAECVQQQLPKVDQEWLQLALEKPLCEKRSKARIYMLGVHEHSALSSKHVSELLAKVRPVKIAVAIPPEKKDEIIAAHTVLRSLETPEQIKQFGREMLYKYKTQISDENMRTLLSVGKRPFHEYGIAMVESDLYQAKLWLVDNAKFVRPKAPSKGLFGSPYEKLENTVAQLSGVSMSPSDKEKSGSLTADELRFLHDTRVMALPPQAMGHYVSALATIMPAEASVLQERTSHIIGQLRALTRSLPTLPLLTQREAEEHGLNAPPNANVVAIVDRRLWHGIYDAWTTQNVDALEEHQMYQELLGKIEESKAKIEEERQAERQKKFARLAVSRRKRKLIRILYAQRMMFTKEHAQMLEKNHNVRQVAKQIIAAKTAATSA
eukprot:Colp12_sorted_trinity150504_noHs@6403